MRHTYLLLGLLLAACQDEKPPEVNLGEALPTIPLPPNGQVLNREAGPDALQLRLRTTSSVERVLEFYREVLSAPPFTLVSDTRSGGSYALYAEQTGKPPLWVTISYDSSLSATLVNIAGAKGRTRP